MIQLDGHSLTLEDVVAVSYEDARLTIAPSSIQKMTASRRFVEDAMCGGQPVYALNTGVGLLADIALGPSEIEAMQVNLVRSHCCGVGEPLERPVVRGLMVIRANVLAKGHSGIRPLIAERICDLLNHGITPVIPARGSVGASGDLAPLAHMALTLIGEGEAEFEGLVRPSIECLRVVGLEPLKLEAKEGISLLNGTQAMLSIACLQFHALERLFAAAQTAAALTMEALQGTPVPFDARLHEARPHPGQIQVAAQMRSLLADSAIPRTQGQSRRIQDAYCLRCIPQVHGAAWDALREARRVFEIELNSATDNPLVFDEDILSGGNFHGAPLALNLDFLAVALCQIAGISERRIERLLNPSLNEGLPAFLAATPGIESGLMIAQVTAAALYAEMRVLASPASVGSLPTSGNQEDFVSMGMTSALKLQQSVNLARTIVAIELLAATRALDLRGDSRATSPILREVIHRFRERVPAWTEDCVLSVPIAKAERFIAEGMVERGMESIAVPQASGVAV
jgi:histidine ammonia-lyase